MKQNNLTRKKVEKFHSLGFSHREISRLVEISRGRVSRILNKLKSTNMGSLNIRKSVLDDKAIVYSVLAMSLDGKSTRVIADHLGIPKTRAWLILKKYGPVENNH